MAWFHESSLQRKTSVLSSNICNKILGQLKRRNLTNEKVKDVYVNKPCLGEQPTIRKKNHLFTKIPSCEENRTLLITFAVEMKHIF